MSMSFLQLLFLIFLCLVLFYTKPTYGKQLNNFITSLIKNIKKYSSMK